MTIIDSSKAVLTEAALGSESDVAAVAQTITSHATQAEAISTKPIDERRENLRLKKSTLEDRLTTDAGHDLVPLIKEIDLALSKLIE